MGLVNGLLVEGVEEEGEGGRSHFLGEGCKVPEGDRAGVGDLRTFRVDHLVGQRKEAIYYCGNFVRKEGDIILRETDSFVVVVVVVVVEMSGGLLKTYSLGEITTHIMHHAGEVPGPISNVGWVEVRCNEVHEGNQGSCSGGESWG